MIFLISEYCYYEAPLIIPQNLLHAFLAFAIYPSIIRLFCSTLWLCLHTSLFYFIFQALLRGGSKWTTSKQFTFLQNHIGDRPLILPFFVMTSYHLLGSDMSLSHLLFVPSTPPPLLFTTHSLPGTSYIHCYLRYLSPLSTSSRERRPTWHGSVPRTTAWQGIPCMTGGWTDWRMK